MCKKRRTSGSTAPARSSGLCPRSLSDRDINHCRLIIARNIKRQFPKASREQKDDLSQEAWVRLLERLTKYTPKRGAIEAFAEAIIPGIVIDLKRRSKAKKRRPIESLEHTEGPLGSARDSITVLNQLHPPQGASLNGNLIPLRMDVQQLVTRLSIRDREMAEAVMSQSVTDYSRTCGTPRSTVRYRLHALQKAGNQNNLRLYLVQPANPKCVRSKCRG